MKEENQKIKEERILEVLTKEEIQQIEEWSEKEVGEILFESDKDEWTTNKVLNEHLIGREKIIIVIEDMNGNKFGGYINSKIEKTGTTWEQGIQDDKAFLYSLRSGGRMNKRLKYPIKESEKAFMINNEEEMKWLFIFGTGSDIVIYKEPYKTLSQCVQSTTYDYQNIQYALRGNCFTFTPKKFSIIQMI